MIGLCSFYIQVTPEVSVAHLKERFIEECGMKKVVVASLLAVASMASVAGPLLAQTQVNLGSNGQTASGGVQLSPA